MVTQFTGVSVGADHTRMGLGGGENHLRHLGYKPTDAEGPPKLPLSRKGSALRSILYIHSKACPHTSRGVPTKNRKKTAGHPGWVLHALPYELAVAVRNHGMKRMLSPDPGSGGEHGD